MIHFPTEVLAFLSDGAKLNEPSLGINVLDQAASAKYTEQIRDIPLFDDLGLIALDDANDSDPYCYITKGVAAGMVVHVSHDDQPRIKFVSLKSFKQFLLDLRKKEEELWTVDPPSPAHPDQALLAKCLEELAERPVDDDTEFLILLYLPLLRTDAAMVLERFTFNESFFVREAVADVVGAAGLPDCEDILTRLRKDKHPQVRSAAERALKR